VLVIEVDHVGIEPFQRGFRHGLDMFGTAVDARHAVEASTFVEDLEAEFGGDRHLVAHRLQRLAEQDLVLKGAVDFRRVEEGHPGLDRRLQDGVRVGLRHVAPVGAELPGAEADDRHVAAGPSECPVLHGPSLAGQW